MRGWVAGLVAGLVREVAEVRADELEHLLLRRGLAVERVAGDDASVRVWVRGAWVGTATVVSVRWGWVWWRLESDRWGPLGWATWRRCPVLADVVAVRVRALGPGRVV